jgi:hypothetical protein
MRQSFNAKAPRHEGAKVLKTYGSCIGNHGLVKVISVPALVGVVFSAFRLGRIAPLR